MFENKKINLLLIIFCVCLSLVLVGCKQDTINFYRESKFQQVMNNLPSVSSSKKKTQVKQASGMLIFKDSSSSKKGSGIIFGPKEINFGMPNN